MKPNRPLQIQKLDAGAAAFRGEGRDVLIDRFGDVSLAEATAVASHPRTPRTALQFHCEIYYGADGYAGGPFG